MYVTKIVPKTRPHRNGKDPNSGKVQITTSSD